MSPDNAAVTLITEEINEESPDPITLMSDREILEYIARNMRATLAIAEAVREQVEPAMTKLTKNPLLGGLFR